MDIQLLAPFMEGKQSPSNLEYSGSASCVEANNTMTLFCEVLTTALF